MKATDIYSLFEAQQELFEVEMSPSSLRKLAAAIPGVKVGMEFEMVVPGVQDPDDEGYEPEEDTDADESADDIDDIIRFFSHEDDHVGQVNSPDDLQELEEELRDKFYEWQGEQILDQWKGEEGKEYFVDWVKNNVDPDEVAEFAGTPEDLFGEKNPSKEDYEKFIEDQWDTEGSYYDEAYDMFRDEKIDEGDFSERDFLRENGIRYMSDVNDNIRMYIRWPYYTEPYYGSGEDIESVADDFSDAIGKRVYSSTSYHGARREPGAYSLEPDSSIDAEAGEAGLEFVSPPMSVDEMIEDLNAVADWARDRGCYTNKSTGLHINVSIPDYNIDKLDYVKLAILLGDKYVLDQFGRIGTQWAKSALDIVKKRAEENPETADKLLNQVKSGVEEIASKILHSGRTDKYVTINTTDPATGRPRNYIEFRSAGGDWLNKNFNKIENTLLRYVVALDAACDPNKYKKEYVKGLYKILKPKDPSSDMSMFAKYMAGQITRSEYVNSLEDKRKERFKGQGIGIIHKDDVDENDWEITYDDGNKSQTIYIANTEAVPDEEAAFNAAKKFKPQWFKPDTVKYVTVKPFKFGEEFDDLKLYRAEYSYKVVSVVAEDEEWAEEYVRLMDPEFFAANPDTPITLTDENEASKRKISQVIDWQTPKIQAGYEWNKRPKIWRASGRGSGSSRYYIAAVDRDEAVNVVTRLDPDMVESDTFDIYVNDAYPDQDTYDAYVKAQEDLIKQREEREKFSQDTGEETEVDLSNVKIYRINNMGGYMYVAAENGGQAAEIASKMDPDKFGDVTNLTAVEQHGTTFGPLVVKNMFLYQQRKLGDQMPTPQPLPRFEVNDRVEVASGYPSLIGRQGKVLQVSPNFNFVSVLIDGNDQPSSFPTASLRKIEDQSSNNDWRGELRAHLGNAQPAFSEPSSSRISDMRSYRVINDDTGQIRWIAGTSANDAMSRAREAYPEFADGRLRANVLD